MWTQTVHSLTWRQVWSKFLIIMSVLQTEGPIPWLPQYLAIPTYIWGIASTTNTAKPFICIHKTPAHVDYCPMSHATSGLNLPMHSYTKVQAKCYVRTLENKFFKKGRGRTLDMCELRGCSPGVYKNNTAWALSGLYRQTPLRDMRISRRAHCAYCISNTEITVVLNKYFSACLQP